MLGIFGQFDDARQAAKPGNRAESQSWQHVFAQTRDLFEEVARPEANKR